MAQIKGKTPIDIVMFNMSDYNEWENKNLVNRNRHILYNLLKRDEIGKILAIDFLPYKLKRGVKDYFSNIQKGGPSIFDIKKKTFFSKCYNTKEYKNLYVFSTIDTLLNEGKVYHEINEIINKLNFQNLIVWSYTPMFTGYFNKIKARKYVFDAVDDWREHEQYLSYRERLTKNYKKIEDKADLIFSVSEKLKELFNENQNVFWLPNGVDVEHFENQKYIPTDIQNIPKPIVGYSGIVEDRFDNDLLEYIAKENPNMSFVIVGWVWGNRKLKLSNVHYLGQKSYQELPNYLHSFDVGIIPHKVNKFTDTMNPLKLYEYLASGMPVVSTDIKGLKGYDRYIRIGKTKEEFNNQIKCALKDDNNISSLKRKSFISKDDWSNRIDFIIDKIT